jgi:DNA-binding NarL/FixJ family response regulator
VRLVREGLVLSLRDRDGITAVDAFDVDLDGLEQLAALAPHVILIDIGHAETANAARHLKIACPNAKLVAFALTEVDDEVFACAAAGYDSYISRDSGADDLFRALMDAANGRMQCPPHIAAAMFSRLSNLLQEAPAPCELPSLTGRENAILTLAEQGRSNKEIARQLGICAATVKDHVYKAAGRPPR